MEIKFHLHAIERMQERKVTAGEIKEVIERPDGRMQQSKDKWIYYRTLKHRRDNAIAAVILSAVPHDLVEVITVLIHFEVKK